jgi:uncharacterized protein (DUF885 family)
MSAIYELSDRYVKELIELDPIVATATGVVGHDDAVTDFSPEGQERIADLRRRTREELVPLDPDTDRDRIAKEALLEHLNLRLELYDAGEHFRVTGSLGSLAGSLRRVFDVMPRSTPDDWRIIATRLQEVPRGIAQITQLQAEGLRRGLTGARRQVAEMARQAGAYSGEDGSRPFYATLVDAFDRTEIDLPSLRADIDRAAGAATGAFAEYAGYLRENYFDAAPEKDAVGPARYQLNSRMYNGTTLDLEETYAWGWDELYRIESEMAETAGRILPGASVEDAKALLESDPDRAVEGVEEFRQWMQQLQDRTIVELDGKHFTIAEPVRRVEAMIAPPGGALAMYYTGPSEDFSRPGRTWYPTGGKTRFPLWGEVSIAYHEGVPGHHFERANAKYLGEQLSRFQRVMGGVSGYVEGWALYAERLMGELGYLDNPDYYLGMLRAQAMRAVRVIVDIGMHLELRIPKTERFRPGEQWTPALGDVFARERSQFPEDFMKSEVTRYLGAPGQAISYKVGERAWLEARQAARKRQGEAFDLKSFHTAALDFGPMGLDQLQREMER